MENTEYRNCFVTDDIAECVFASKNENGTHCCTVDGVIHTRWYGCHPQEEIDKLDKEEID